MRSSGKSARRAALFVGILVFAAAAVFGYLRSSHLSRLSGENAPSQSAASSNDSPEARTGMSPKRQRSGTAKPPRPRARLSSVEVDRSWKKFQSSFGKNLIPNFTQDHRIANIRSDDTPALPAPGFRSGDKDAALSRAKQILDHAADLIGLNPAFPLDAPRVRSDEISSQVEWVQTYDGIPVEPFGRVTVQLDQNGGLRGVYSNYISDPEIGNEPTLDSEAAKEAAVSGLPFRPEHPEQIRDGQLVLYAAGPQADSSSVPLRYAYRFQIEGREVILDASNGKILSSRDERQF